MSITPTSCWLWAMLPKWFVNVSCMANWLILMRSDHPAHKPKSFKLKGLFPLYMTHWIFWIFAVIFLLAVNLRWSHRSEGFKLPYLSKRRVLKTFFSACELIWKWWSQHDLPTLKFLNRYLFIYIYILSILCMHNICWSTLQMIISYSGTVFWLYSLHVGKGTWISWA